eukprot:364265-Chlamydomonas_euryale.AAC.5
MPVQHTGFPLHIRGCGLWLVLKSVFAAEVVASPSRRRSVSPANMSGVAPATYSNFLGVPYVCGNCGSEVLLKPGDVIQCRDCGARILYKKRTKRVVQFEAR